MDSSTADYVASAHALRGNSTSDYTISSMPSSFEFPPGQNHQPASDVMANVKSSKDKKVVNLSTVRNFITKDDLLVV